jgi:methyl-accepting chemotaxis protein
MEKKTKKAVLYLILAGLIAGLVYYFFQPLADFSQPVILKLNTAIERQLAALSPACHQPIYYSLGEIDSRFNLSREEIIKVTAEAAGLWSQPFGQTLFAYATSGELKINFIYDYRQQTSDQLKDLGVIVDDDKKTYDNLKVEFDTLNQQYLEKKSQLQRQITDYEKKLKAFNAEVAKWNQRGGAPAAEYGRLKQTEAALEQQRQQVNALTSQANKMADELNLMARKLNQLITKLNLNVNKYNNVGGQTGEQFEAGVYTQNATSTSISVYEFNDRQELVRLLAHELGHALGLDHSSSSDDIMYYLNISKNATPTPADLAALKAKCEAK